MRYLIALLVLLIALPVLADDYNEDEVLFEYEQEFCKRFTLVMLTWGNDGHGCWWHSLDQALPHRWRNDDSGHRNDHRYLGQITFSAFGYYKGDPQPGNAEVMALPDQGRTITREYPPEAVDVNEQITDSITLTQSIAETYSEDTSFNVTKGVSASVTAGFEAGTAGVKASGSVTVEGSIEVSQGKAFGHSTEQDTTKEVSQSITTDVSVPKDSKTILLTIQVGKSRSTYDVQENGYIDFSGCFDIYRWSKSQWLRGSVAFTSDSYQKDGPLHFCWNNVEELLDILSGDKPREFPNMDGWLHHVCTDKSYWGNQGACDAFNWLNDPDNRHVSLTRTLVIESEQAGKVTVQYEQ